MTLMPIGIVNVSAKDLGTGKSSIVTLPGLNMSDDDIEVAVKGSS